MRPTHPAAAVAGALLVALVGSTSACSSNRPSAEKTASGGRKAFVSCLRDHHADPSPLSGLLTTGTIDLTGDQLDALRRASPSCEKALTPGLRTALAAAVQCLADRGYSLDVSAPLTALLSLDLEQPQVRTAAHTCLTDASPKVGGTAS
jgi:hypothetical protein